jgi:hypothetical protein
MCEATAKLGNRSTAWIAVKPIAGVVRIAQAMIPFSTSCATSTALGMPLHTTSINLNPPLSDWA